MKTDATPPVLAPSTGEAAFVAGYDFFADGSAEVANRLDALQRGGTDVAVRRLISDTWTANDLSCALLGQPISQPCSIVPAIATHSTADAHYTHYAALSANGFNTKNYGDYLTSSGVASAGGGSGLQRKLLITIGCHAGFSAPDGSVIPADAIFGFDTRLDFAQAVARQRGVFIASTGFGLGETEGLGGTEALLVVLSETIAGRSTGQALREAKVRFITEQANPSVYDEKSMIQVVHYGIPHYASGFSGPSSTQAVLAQADQLIGGTVLTFNYPALASGTGTATPSGSYFAGPDGADGAPYRPLQPRDLSPLGTTAAGTPTVHGAFITAATFREILAFDPVISRPTIEWEEDPQEPQVCVDAFTPASLFRVNSLETPAGLQQTLVVTPAQFACDTAAYEGSGTVTGIERVFPGLSLEVLRSTSPDLHAPAVTGIDLRKKNDGTIELTVAAVDSQSGAVPPSGLGRIVVLRQGSGTLVAIADVSSAAAQTSWTAEIPFGAADSAAIRAGDGLIVQVADVAGNVTWYTNKGAAIRFIDFDASGGPVITPGTTVTFTTTLTAATLSRLTAPVFYLWTFGDGTTASGTVPCTSGPGAVDCQLSVTHTFPAGTVEFTATLRIFDSGGGIGTDDVYVRVCTDPAGDQAGSDAALDLVGCAVSSDATTMTITLFTRGPLLTPAGLPATGAAQFRLNFDTGTGGSFREELRYRDGVFSGLPSASGSVQNTVAGGGQLRFTFALADIGRSGANRNLPLQFQAEVRSGVPGAPSAGLAELLPDSGGIFLIAPEP